MKEQFETDMENLLIDFGRTNGVYNNETTRLAWYAYQLGNCQGKIDCLLEKG